MFIKRNRTQHGGKPYQSVLLVQGKRVPGKRPPGRPAAGSPRPKSVVVHQTLANLSRLPADLITLIEGYCQGAPPDAAKAQISLKRPFQSENKRRFNSGKVGGGEMPAR